MRIALLYLEHAAKFVHLGVLLYWKHYIAIVIVISTKPFKGLILKDLKGLLGLDQNHYVKCNHLFIGR